MRLRILLGMLFGLGIVIGCDEDEPEPKPYVQYVKSISMMLGADTLWFTPGDSVSMTITIIVSDYDDYPVAGKKVSLGLSNPQLGYIEFLDPDLRDTTNAMGAVDLLYTAIGTPGDCIIYASTEGGYPNYICTEMIDSHHSYAGTGIGIQFHTLTVSDTLAIRQAPLAVGVITMTVVPEWISVVAGDTVEVEICIALHDIEDGPIVGFSVPIFAREGRLPPLPATNASGRACTAWSLTAEQGDHCFYYFVGQVPDSACVHINIIDSLTTNQTGAVRCE